MYPIVTPRLARRTGSTQPRSRNEPLYPLLLLRREDTLFHAFVSRGCAAKGRSRALSLSRESLAGALCLRGCIKHRCLSLTRNNGETEMRIDLYDVSSPRGNASSIFREKAIELARSNLDLARIVARNKVTPDNSLPVSLTTFLLSKHARSCTDSFRKFKNSCHQMSMPFQWTINVQIL